MTRPVQLGFLRDSGAPQKPGATLVRAMAGRLPLGAAVLCGVVGCAGSPSPSDLDKGASASTVDEFGSCSPVDAATAPACPDAGPSFAADIQPLLNRDCNTCHTPGSTLWPLVGYENVRDWSYSILLDVDGCRMPPADGGTALSSTDRSLLVSWIACGAANN